jgi:hypothetical protein
MSHLPGRVRLIALLSLLLLLAACNGQSAPPATQVAEAVAEATVAPTQTLPPTATLTATATDIPSPTPTETPTGTPTVTPTRTPRPTRTPTATRTPAPTHTPSPVPSETPTPAVSPTPRNTPVPPTATPAPVLDTITIFYLSNPNDVLGVFPVKAFDASVMLNNMKRMRQSLYTMRDALPGTREGSAEACTAYRNAYSSIMNSGVFYEDVPGDWEQIDFVYFISFIYSLDRTRPAFLSCVNAGQVDDFNAGLASQSIDQTLTVLLPAIQSAAAKLGVAP